MLLDTATIAFMTGLMFATLTVAVFAQFRVNVSYRGAGWWLVGTALQAVGFILMLAITVGPIRRLAMFANPLVVLGQMLLYGGTVRFLGKPAHGRLVALGYAAFLAVYYYFIFIDSSLMGRSLVVSVATALVAGLIALSILAGRQRSYAGSAIFTATVFLAYSLFQATLTAATFVLPPLISYADIKLVPVRVISFIVPMIASLLWTFGFVLMFSQRLNAENLDRNRELQLVLKEVHHRIKNNMNTMVSLLSLQADSLDDATAVAALTEAGERLQSMGLLYDKLYRSADFSELSLRDYLPALVDDVLANFPRSANLSVEKAVDDIRLDAKRLQPVGLIVNELLTNAMKYAFSGRSGGQIAVTARLDGGLVRVTVADDGPGLPPGGDFQRSTGFGLMLVKALAEQLNGNIYLEPGVGTRVALEFKR